MTSERPATDSAGVPWAGRTLAPTPFAGDDGSAAPGLAEALGRWSAGGATEAEVVAAVAAARLLVAVVAVLGGDAADGVAQGVRVAGDKEADMALVTVTAPDGRRAVPAFTSTAALARWDAQARPVPAEAARVCLSAVAEGCQAVVLDLAGPVPFELRQARVWALAQGRTWVPPHEDDEVRAAVAEAAGRVPGVAQVRCSPGLRGDLRVEVVVPPGLDRPGLDAVVGGVREALAGLQVVAERTDELELAVVPS